MNKYEFYQENNNWLFELITIGAVVMFIIYVGMRLG